METLYCGEEFVHNLILPVWKGFDPSYSPALVLPFGLSLILLILLVSVQFPLFS